MNTKNENIIITQCSYCGQYQNEDGTWNGIKQEINRHDPNISHGICDKCFDAEIKKVEAAS
jgi:hypothetical protein